jgi:hypothetical protein
VSGFPPPPQAPARLAEARKARQQAIETLLENPPTVVAPDALALFLDYPHDRHTAGGDAFITAQMFLRLILLAGRFGRGTLACISEPFEVEIPS